LQAFLRSLTGEVPPNLGPPEEVVKTQAQK